MVTTMTRQARSTWVLVLACAVTFVVIMDATIVSVALPDIRAEVGFSPATLPWVVNAYTLAFAGFLLLGGRVADVAGRRPTLIAGTVVFTVFRSVAGLTDDPAVLLVARTVQGIGGALLIPVTLALITTTFTDPAARVRALGTWSAVGGIGAALGPVIGGLLIDWVGWRWVFHVTVPVGVAVVVCAALVLPRTPPRVPHPRLDLVGAMLGTVGLLGVIFSIMRSAASSWTAPEVWGPLLAGILLVGVFLLHQARTSEPLMPLDLFHERAVSSANTVMFLLGLGFFASPVLISLYLQDVLSAGRRCSPGSATCPSAWRWSPVPVSPAHSPFVSGRGSQQRDSPPSGPSGWPRRRSRWPSTARSPHSSGRSCCSASARRRASRPSRSPRRPWRPTGPGWPRACSTPSARPAGRSGWPR